MASGGQATLNAVVIGGTGATGRHLVGTLLKAKARHGHMSSVQCLVFFFVSELARSHLHISWKLSLLGLVEVTAD